MSTEESDSNAQVAASSTDLNLHSKYVVDVESFVALMAGSLSVSCDRVCQVLYAGLPSGGLGGTDLLEHAATEAAALALEHPDYARLAARLMVAALHASTPKTFSEAMEALYCSVSPSTGRPCPVISDEVATVTRKNKDRLNRAINTALDYEFNYAGVLKLRTSYLLRSGGEIVERPQYMYMRVSIGIHGADIERVLETYELLSSGRATHATPTLTQAGTPRPQLASCFLVAMEDDSIVGIYNTLRTNALISKSAGGIGLHVHDIRAKGAHISGTNGTSNGLIPMLKVFNETARYVDQGGNRRPGAVAVYIEPWHADVYEVLELRRNTGLPEHRARDLFYGMWVPDLFMKRVEADGDWSLMCPLECPGLSDSHGAEFDALYERYEAEGRVRRKVRARDLLSTIAEMQIESGMPYMLYKDACNAKSNQSNLGTIKSSNLCTEIVEFSSPGEVAVCNLASLALPRFAIGGVFDHAGLHATTRAVTRNLNAIIDRTMYPVEAARASNNRHRPIGIGVQGLADTFKALRLEYGSAESRALNIEIFATIYHAALTESMCLARENGPYESFHGSPASEGRLQFDLWGEEPSPRYDWVALKNDIKEHGLRNSLLTAPMPTASTSKILGNSEGMDPYANNVFVHRDSAGDVAMVNEYLVRDLSELGLWSPSMKTRIIASGGSIADFDDIPTGVRALHRTSWEISNKTTIDMSADRGPYVDQSQSLNLYLARPDVNSVCSMHMYGWKRGLKTGMYYLRTKPAAVASPVTVDPSLIPFTRGGICPIDAGPDCDSCSA